MKPKTCTNTKKHKHLNIFSKIIKSYRSTDDLLKLFKDFENMKYLCIMEKEIELFESKRCLTLNEHFSKIEKINQNNKDKCRNH